MAKERFPAGWTDPIDYALEKDGASFDATGMTIDLVLRDRQGTELEVAGSVVFTDAATSQARFTPGAADFTVERSPLRARFKVTSGAQVAYFPKDTPLEWVIDEP